MRVSTVVLRLTATAVAAAAMLGAAAAPAGAWPYPLNPYDIRFLDTVRGTFPGDDDQLLTVGKQMCRLLYTGLTNQAAIEQTAAQHGVSVDQAAHMMRAACGNLCTTAPGQPVGGRTAATICAASSAPTAS